MEGKGHFIYVSGDKDRDKLLKAGFTLLKSDKKRHQYVFANNSNNTRQFDTSGITCVPSDVLTY